MSCGDHPHPWPGRADSAAETLAELRAGIADDETLVDLNTARSTVSTPLWQSWRTPRCLPFLAERRLVIVEGLLRRLAASPKRPKVTEGAEKFESSEGVEDEGRCRRSTRGRRRSCWLTWITFRTRPSWFLSRATLLAEGAILRRLLELQRDGRARRHRLFESETQRAGGLDPGAGTRFRKVKLDANAVADLADFIGDELRQIDQELLKLADYAAKERTITRVDVRQLVPATREPISSSWWTRVGMGDAQWQAG